MFHLFAGDGEGPAAAAGGRGGAWARGGPPCSKYGLPSDVLARITSGLCCCCLNCFAKRRRAHSGAAGGRAGRAALRGKGLHCPSAVLPPPCAPALVTGGAAAGRLRAHPGIRRAGRHGLRRPGWAPRGRERVAGGSVCVCVCFGGEWVLSCSETVRRVFL